MSSQKARQFGQKGNQKKKYLQLTKGSRRTRCMNCCCWLIPDISSVLILTQHISITLFFLLVTHFSMFSFVSCLDTLEINNRKNCNVRGFCSSISSSNKELDGKISPSYDLQHQIVSYLQRTVKRPIVFQIQPVLITKEFFMKEITQPQQITKINNYNQNIKSIRI